MFLKYKKLDLQMHKLLNFFCFPILITGAILVSNGLLGYNFYVNDIKANLQTSKHINTLYSEKEITLKDPPVSEKLSKKLFVNIKIKPINPNIISKIENNLDLKTTTNLSDNDFDYLQPNKKQFVKTVLPIIINENQKILISRNFINDLKTKLNTFKTLNNNEIKKLNNIAKKHNIKFSNKHK